MNVDLPISKSIANRLLILQAVNKDPLMEVFVDMPDDIRVMHSALEDIEKGVANVNIDNCGTAMRFLTAYCANKENCDIVLDGCERMRKRPIGQLVDALRDLGAEIEYMGNEGFPPLHICGKLLPDKPVTILHPVSTQFVSALMLIGANVITDSQSPYISMTRQVASLYKKGTLRMEKDWSSAAFWYEHVALHGGEIFFPKLTLDSVQGDRKVADIFARFGVKTDSLPDGIRISRLKKRTPWFLYVDFRDIPDLYPAVAITSRKLHCCLLTSGTASLRIKESNRLQAVRLLQTRDDHRMAMALVVAGYSPDNLQCVRKSYPLFSEQWNRISK